MDPKVDLPESVTYLNRTSIFEWYVVWCGSKNRYHKDMFLRSIALHAQNMVPILSSIVNITEGTHLTN